MLAREIERDPKVLIAAQPTRGLDVGAIEFVHRRLVEERDEGRAILLISLELDEILSLSDRILVIYEGELVGEFPPTVAFRKPANPAQMAPASVAAPIPSRTCGSGAMPGRLMPIQLAT